MGKESNRWKKLNNLFEPLSKRISNKIIDNKSINFIDLLRLKNFKGGNAQFFEKEEIINNKLEIYSQLLFNFREKDKDEFIKKFFNLIKDNKSKIEGFGNSFATTLLNLSFPKVFPIMDRKVLIGLKIIKYKKINNKKIFIYNKEKNINIYSIMDKYGLDLYIELYKRFDEIKLKDKNITLRNLDEKYFNLGTKILKN